MMTCPLCHNATIWEGNPWRPFCSERCQLTDLGAWAMEEYRVPGPNLTMELPSQNPDEPEAAGDRPQNSPSKKPKIG